MNRYPWIILQDLCRSNQKEIADSEETLGLCWSAFSCNAFTWCNKIYLETRGTLIAQHLWIFMLKSVKVTKHLVALCWQFVISENQIYPAFKSSITFRSGPQRVKSQISCFCVNADSDKLPTTSIFNQQTSLLSNYWQDERWTRGKERRHAQCVFARVCIIGFLVSCHPSALLCCRVVCLCSERISGGPGQHRSWRGMGELSHAQGRAG